MFYADKYTTSEVIGFTDTDTFFTTVPTAASIFDGDKPIIIGVWGYTGDLGDIFWAGTSNIPANLSLCWVT